MTIASEHNATYLVFLTLSTLVLVIVKTVLQVKGDKAKLNSVKLS